MKTTNCISVWSMVCAALLLVAASVKGAEPAARPAPRTKLTIQRNLANGKVVSTWTGKGVLKKAASLNDRFRPVRHGQGEYVFDPAESQAVFRLEGTPSNDPSNIYSINVVGYVNMRCPPGLSLVANPLQCDPTNDVVGELWPNAPDGLQVYKSGPDLTYEVSTFDGIAHAWSNPRLDISIGTGFYVQNPTSVTITQIFVGNVLQGVLVNPLPAGFSTKGALVPQEGSINSIHLIPGQPGDRLSLYTNDGNGGGSYSISDFSAAANAWVPDQVLHVAQGFWIQKQQAQDWVRVFYVGP